MADDLFICPRCGHRLSVAPGGPRILHCPDCGDALRPDRPAAGVAGPADPLFRETSSREDASSDPLRLDRAAYLGGAGRRCPACRLEAPEGNRFCGACGTDLATGERPAPAPPPATSRRRRAAAAGRAAAAMALLLAAGAAWWRFGPPNGWSMRTGRGAARPETSAPASPAPSAAVHGFFREWRADGAARDRIRAEWDAKAPLRRPGDAAAVILKTRRVVRGTLVKPERSGTVRIDNPNGVEEFALEDLAPESRLQLDPAWRAEQIQAAVERERGRGGASTNRAPASR